MGTTISFSGIGNCGKTTIIRTIKKELENNGLSVTVKGEVARELLQSMDPQEDMARFQEAISSQEYIRAYHLEKELADVILVDRTYMDNVAYFVYNAMKGKVTGQTRISIPEVDPYDHIIYFDTPIKETTTEMFQHYDDEVLKDIMTKLVKGRFGEKVKLFQNGMEDEQKVLDFVREIITPNILEDFT